MLILFISLIYFGKWTISPGEKIYFRDYAQNLWLQTLNSLILILPAVLVTIILSFFLEFLEFSSKFLSERNSDRSKILNKLFFFISKFISLIPVICSAIPPFITGILFIFIAKLDTIDSPNSGTIFSGIICLALFNLSYFYKISVEKITNAYREPSVLFARSAGLPENIILKYYVFPGVLKAHLIIIKNLIPHIIVETVLIEYVFSYTGLMRSVIDDILYRSWHHLFLVIFILALFVTFCEIFFEFIENTIFCHS